MKVKFFDLLLKRSNRNKGMAAFAEAGVMPEIIRSLDEMGIAHLLYQS